MVRDYLAICWFITVQRIDIFRTSPTAGRTVDHLCSFNPDQSRALDHWYEELGALNVCSPTLGVFFFDCHPVVSSNQ